MRPYRTRLRYRDKCHSVNSYSRCKQKKALLAKTMMMRVRERLYFISWQCVNKRCKNCQFYSQCTVLKWGTLFKGEKNHNWVDVKILKSKSVLNGFYWQWILRVITSWFLPLRGSHIILLLSCLLIRA